MRKFNSILILLFFSLSSFSQRVNTYLPSKQNFRIKYVAYDSKDRREYTEIWKLVGKVKQKGVINYNIESEITTRKHNRFYQYFRLVNKDSVFYIGTERYLNPRRLDAYRRMVIKISSDSVSIPTKPQIGQMLPSSSCKANILRGTGDVIVSMNILLINRKIDGIEVISTPAGSFKCYKISSDKLTFSGIRKSKTKIFEWYAANVGLVRIEERQAKGKLISYKVIESLAEEFYLP